MRQVNWTRREFLYGAFIQWVALTYGASFLQGCVKRQEPTETFIAKIKDYEADIASSIITGMRELSINSAEIKGKKILLKPNLIESKIGALHVTTHPLVIRGAAEAFLKLGAKQVVIGEASGHSRDSMRVIEEVGLIDVLSEDGIPFVDLNSDDFYTIPSLGHFSKLKTFSLPATLHGVDWVVSMPKMKTHHWAGFTLSMKNLFGILPGIIYGWPKNVLHYAGIDECILDINATVKPHFAIVDGIVGMEGDGPIMGTPRYAGVIVMGRNFPAVDATCVRIMGYDPRKVSYLRRASEFLGPIDESYINQHGETVKSVLTKFSLEEKIPAHRKIYMNDPWSAVKEYITLLLQPK
jgi:uncharacterized protein (DUF362 family)